MKDILPRFIQDHMDLQKVNIQTQIFFFQIFDSNGGMIS